MHTFTIKGVAWDKIIIFFPGEKYGRDVRIVFVDFSEGQSIYPALAEQIQDLDIGILSMKLTCVISYQ